MTKKKISASFILVAFATYSMGALATEVLFLEGNGAISRAMGGTGVSHDVGAAGMMINPATLSFSSSERQVLVGVDVIAPNIKARNLNTGETAESDWRSNNRGPYFAPEIAYTQRFGNWTVGVGAFPMAGVGTEYGKNNFLARDALGVDTGLPNSDRLLVLDIPFAVSYQVTDALTVGGSLDAIWEGLNLNIVLTGQQVGAMAGMGRVSGSMLSALPLNITTAVGIGLTKDNPIGSGVDAWGYGGRLGFTYKLSEQTTLGASYSFKSNMSDMSGKATVTAVILDPNAGYVQMPMRGSVKVLDFQMPSKLSLGMSHKITRDWLVAADVSRVYWSDVLKDIKIAFSTAAGDINLRFPQNNKDVTTLAVGTSYALNEEWTLRAGVRISNQSFQDNTVLALIAGLPTKHVSMGFSYTPSKASRIDFAYSHAFKESMSNTSLPNADPTVAPFRVSHSQNNFTLSYNYSF